MSERISINLDIQSPYIEPNGKLYRFKRRLTYRFAFRLLNKFLDRYSFMEILEVGTGSGFFLDFARHYFPNSNFSGVEYDERLVNVSRDRAPHAIILQGSAETFSLGLSKFNIIVSFQVIEHLYEPSSMLANVRAHLKPGGVFLFTTPNLSGIGARLMKSRWHGYRDDHVSLKGIDDWDQLLKSHGFITLYSGSTFFSGVPLLNRFPFGIVNWLLLFCFGSLRWSLGESYVGVFKSIN